MEHTRAIMPIAFRQLSTIALPLLLLGSGSVKAQQGSSDPAMQLIKGGGTPAVFGGRNQPLPASSCPAIVNLSAGQIQPMRIAPAQVASKNRLGCLSPNDAIYGANGCPTQLCGQSRGAVPLPASIGIGSGKLQLPEP
jgi:hypothetical protein